MRKNINESASNGYKIICVDDEPGVLDNLSVFFRRNGYDFTGITNPLEAIELVKNEHFDLMLLDYIMTPIHGDQVVEEIRKFNKELYILLLTGHSELAPPLEIIKKLEIQGYCEKMAKNDQLQLLVESGIKAVEQMNIIKKINNELKETNAKLEKAYLETIETLRFTVEAKDTYTRGHSDRVSEYSVLLGKYLGLSDEDLNLLRVGGLFHDIGKIGVPDSILLKTSRLTNDEYSEIKNHPKIGAQILSNATIFEKAIPIVKYHHERYDGCGYPEKLSGENIPYLARIAAVADSFDAMTSRRTYRDSMDLDIVKQEIEKNKETQFDPKIADKFLDILNNHYNEIQEIRNKYI